jgi:hypothetical protein
MCACAARFRVKRAASGHLYLSLKDEMRADRRGHVEGHRRALGFAPEDGIEVIATGKLTTYPGRSSYQIVIERMEIAGEGALLALLERLKRAARRRGAVRAGAQAAPALSAARDRRGDIADRRGDPRYPAPPRGPLPQPCAVWPVLVQGEGAAAQVAMRCADSARCGRAGRDPAARSGDRRARGRLDRGPVGVQRGDRGARGGGVFDPDHLRRGA